MNGTYTPELPPDVLQRLDAYAAQFRPDFPRARPARWAGVCLRGLIQDGRRKSIGPMARRLALPSDLRVADPEQTAQEAAAEMARGDVGVLPVVAGGGGGEEGQILGMLTDRDLAVRVVAAGKDPAKTKVREAMTRFGLKLA